MNGLNGDSFTILKLDYECIKWGIRMAIQASVYMITKNEERFLKETLACLVDFDEVIVVDCGSSDQTPTIAKSFSNVKFFHHEWEGFARQKQWALDQCSHEWVVNVCPCQSVFQ